MQIIIRENLRHKGRKTQGPLINRVPSTDVYARHCIRMENRTKEPKVKRDRRLNWPVAQSLRDGTTEILIQAGAPLDTVAALSKAARFQENLTIVVPPWRRQLTNTLHTQLGNYIYLSSFIIYGSSANGLLAAPDPSQRPPPTLNSPHFYALINDVAPSLPADDYRANIVLLSIMIYCVDSTCSGESIVDRG